MGDDTSAFFFSFFRFADAESPSWKMGWQQCQQRICLLLSSDSSSKGGRVWKTEEVETGTTVELHCLKWVPSSKKLVLPYDDFRIIGTVSERRQNGVGTASAETDTKKKERLSQNNPTMRDARLSTFLLLLSSFPHATSPFTIAIVGANGGLGRELCKQGVERGFDCLAGQRRREDILEPARGGWLSEPPTQRGIQTSQLLVPCLIEEINHYSYHSLLFVCGSLPFQEDTSDKTMLHLLDDLSPVCKSVGLVSAYGVGEYEVGNLGIQAMRGWYLEDVYRAKREMESLLEDCDKVKVKKVWRPKVLSYGPIPFNTIHTERRTLAGQILDWVEECDV